MSNNFLKDKEYGRQYEVYFALLLNYKLNDVNGDDRGVDLISPDGSIKIDVKAYKRPVKTKHYTGVYLETYQKLSKNPGWFFDMFKETTHYLFVVDCLTDRPSFYKYYIIKRDDLHKAFDEAYDNGDIKEAEYETTKGYILPYEYIKKYCVKEGYGDEYYEEKQNSKR